MLKKYRKKPMIIEAYQTDEEIIIHTLEGDMRANPGDYIITGIRGEKYPCKKDIFEAYYELVDDVDKNPDFEIYASMKFDTSEIDEALKKMERLVDLAKEATALGEMNSKRDSEDDEHLIIRCDEDSMIFIDGKELCQDFAKAADDTY